MKYASLICVFCFFVAGCTPIADLNTQYSRPDLKNTFGLIQIGESVENVYKIIGPPLFVRINPDRFGDGAYRQTYVEDTTVAAVAALAANTNYELYLSYTYPKRAGKDYLQYFVHVRDGKVFRRGGPVYAD